MRGTHLAETIVTGTWFAVRAEVDLNGKSSIKVSPKLGFALGTAWDLAECLRHRGQVAAPAWLSAAQVREIPLTLQGLAEIVGPGCRYAGGILDCSAARKR